MDDEQEDVKKMTDFLTKQKSNYQSNFQLEFQDFVNFKQFYTDQEYEDEVYDDDESDFEDSKIKDISIDSTKFPILTEEEQSVINSCSDSELKRLLMLNRSKNMQLIKLHKRIQELLLECEDELEEKNFALKNMETKQIYQQTFVWKLAAPYFKDRKFFPSPLNQDTIKKRAQNELSMYDLIPSPKWTPIEFDRLTNAIKCNYNINKQNDINNKMKSLKCRIKNDDDDNKNDTLELLDLKNKLEEVKNDDKVPPLNSNEFLDWYKVSETFLKDKHTPIECQAVWHMLVHPSINKNQWTEEENKSLEVIAKRYSYQNWDQIAIELKTNRTGFTTCLHYFSKLCDKFKKSKFTPEEDAVLLEVVDIYKIGNFIPWNKVVHHFNNRSRHQLYHRYTYFLSHNHVKKGKFSEAEDILLIILVNKFKKNFKKCAEYMPHRSQIQLKSRYNSNLQRHIKKGTFTEKDDQFIYEYVQTHGEKSWSSLAKQLDRCNAQVRHRYKLIKTFLQDNPDAKVGDIPKRKHRFDEINEGQYNFLNYMAEQYNNVDYIPTLSMIEKSLQSGLFTSPNHLGSEDPLDLDVKTKNINAMLTNFFSSSVRLKQNNTVTETNLNEAAKNAEEVLRLLNAHLVIPQNLETNTYLDNIDIEILEKIQSKNFNGTEMKISKLLPPNVGTLLGLRRAIIKHKEYKLKQKNKFDKFSWPMTVNLKNFSGEERSKIMLHRNLFAKRFEALFNWSAVLSLEKPPLSDSATISNASNDVTTASVTTAVKSHAKRSLTDQGKSPIKKRKIDASVLSNLSQQIRNSQLKVVDKNVIEKLITNTNINIIKIDNINGKDGAVKSILNRKKPVNKTYSSKTKTSERTTNLVQPTDTSCLENVDEMLDDEDLQEDVEKLNNMLKSVKSETITDQPSSSRGNDEYQVIKDDVQLLKEILEYEKVKVKPDPDNYL